MWEPMGSTVLVKKAAPRDVTDGGIVLPTAQMDLTIEGVVTHTPEKLDWLYSKRVLFSRYAGSEVKIGSESLLIMKFEDILAVWQDEDNGNV